MMLHEGRKQTAGEPCQRWSLIQKKLEEVIIQLGGEALLVDGVNISASELIVSDGS